MKKNPNLESRSLRAAAIGLTLFLPTLGACKSTDECEKTKGPNIIGAPSEETAWTVIETSGKEPTWKDEEQSGYFWGEGLGKSEAEAFLDAERSMRVKAANFLGVTVQSVDVVRRSQINDKLRESIDQIQQVSTDEEVKGMAVDENYREKRWRCISGFGKSYKEYQHRVMVRGKLQ